MVESKTQKQTGVATQMVNKIYCATKNGVGGEIVEVQATFVRALPAFVITGLANNSIQESKQRVQSALTHIGFHFPPLKIAINLSPADLNKTGSHFDLPIALLIALQKENATPIDWFAFGELGLDGEIKHSDSLYPLLLEVALLRPNAKVLLPRAGQNLFSYIPNLNMYYADTLKEALEIIQNLESKPAPKKNHFDFHSIIINDKNFYYSTDFKLDFKEVKGQEIAKRAALIAASGFHNIILEGSPGCGKSMIAKRLRYILPPMDLEDMIECVKLQALSSQETKYSPIRNFRAPHQSASKSSILGSATQYEAKPGEVALAHNGVLFFDELPYFGKDILESLREPLENNELIVSRVHSKVSYKTSFLFIGAQNPCPCGNLLSQTKECRCTDKEILSYKNRLSEPFLDRIDIFVQMQENEANKQSSITSKEMQEKVFAAFERQIKRNQSTFNGKLSESEIETFCVLDSATADLLAQASIRFNLSHRAIQKIKKLARTIADLDESDTIAKKHLLEALSYRKIA